MEIDKAEELADRVDAHCITLLRLPGTKEAAVAWMEKAFNLMEESAKELRARPTVTKTVYVRVEPEPVAEPEQVTVQQVSSIPKKAPEGFFDQPPIWGGKVTVYGDKYQNRNQPWTKADTRKLVAQREREKRKLK